MSTTNFKIYHENSDISDSNYVTICAGKGKKENSKIYIENDSFSYIEGLIWDRYREYGSSNKIKISSSDWQRIVDGIIFAKGKLGSININEIKNVLKFEIFNPATPIKKIVDELDKLKTFLDEFTICILDFTEVDKYIQIIKNEE